MHGFAVWDLEPEDKSASERIYWDGQGGSEAFVGKQQSRASLEANGRCDCCWYQASCTFLWGGSFC